MIGKLIFLISLMATVAIFVYSVPADTSLWLILAQISGVFGLLGLSWSFLLSIRHQFLERLFGSLDKVYFLHHLLGGASFILLINHPIFLIINSLPANTLTTYLLPGSIFSYSLGILALYTLIILLVLTLYIDLPYWLWKQTHEWMGLVILLGGAHSVLVPSGLMSSWPLRVWLAGWILLAVFAVIYKRYLYYWLLPVDNYRVSGVAAVGDIVVVTLAPVSSLKLIRFSPGQFGFIDLNRPGRTRDEHPFSMISLASGELQLGAKIVGDFTAALLRSAVGSVVTLRGPYGNFGQAVSRAKSMVWIAGGIGITPFISLLSAILPDQSVVMFYSTKGSGPGLLTVPFTDYQKINPHFCWQPIDSTLQGRLTSKQIIGSGLLSTQTYFFLCGPAPMMASLVDQLVMLGVRRKKIIYEDFGFR